MVAEEGGGRLVWTLSGSDLWVGEDVTLVIAGGLLFWGFLSSMTFFSRKNEYSPRCMVGQGKVDCKGGDSSLDCAETILFLSTQVGMTKPGQHRGAMGGR
jgi:hypothetical protein